MCESNGQENQHECAFLTPGQILLFPDNRVLGEIPNANLAGK